MTLALLPPKASKLELEISLPPENDLGNVEYKIHIINFNNKRFHKIATQMAWRIHEGNGICYYHIGVTDNGSPQGISYRYTKESMENLQSVCDYLKYTCEVVYFRKGIGGGFCIKIVVLNDNSTASYGP